MIFNFTKCLGLAVTVSCLLSASDSGHAGDLIGPDLTLYKSDADQDDAAVAYNTVRDEYLVVWADSGGSVFDVKAVRLSATGSELAQFTVASGSNRRYAPDVAYDPVHDRYLVVYSMQYSMTDQDVWGRFIPWDGPDAAMTEIIIGSAAHDEQRPRVAYGRGGPPGGQFLVTWTTNVDSDWFIRGALVNAETGGVGTPWRISPASRLFDFSSVAYLESRTQFLVIAVGQYLTADEDILGVILDTSGNPQHGGWFPIAESTEVETIPDVAAFPAADQYVVVFFHSMTELDVKAQRVAGDGSLTGPVLEVDRSSFPALFPRVACMQTSLGCCLIAWEQMSGYAPAPSGVQARMIGKEGPPGKLLWIIDPSIAGASRENPDVAAGFPDFLAVWAHDRDTGLSTDLHGSLVMPAVFLDGFESSDTDMWSTHTP